MKKILLSLAVILTYAASAQQTISFEASEGYTLGPVEGQNGISGTFPDSEIGTVSISNEKATDGLYALQFTSDFSEWDWIDGVIIPVGNNTGSFEISFDIYPESDEDSDIHIYGLQSEDLNFASSMIFDYFGEISTRQGSETSIVDTYTGADWYNIKMVFDYGNSTLSYFIDDVQVSTGSVIGTTTGVDRLMFGYDNYGSGFTIDNIVVTTNTGSNSDFAKNSFTVYPNPATDMLNLTAKDADGINNISITDVNGRTVKQQKFDGAASVQVNVNDLNSGVYFVAVESAQGNGTTKFVKK